MNNTGILQIGCNILTDFYHMKQAKNTRHRNMLRAFTSGDYDRIDTAIRELEAVNDEVTWVAMLRDCLITKDGVLIASEELTVSGNRQPAADYGILELIGRIPKELKTNPTIERGNIRKLKIRKHEGQSGVYWSMKRFPTGIYRLSKLRSLNLLHAGFEELPEGISALKQLEELILANNHLETLPADLGGCEQLRLLDLACNRLTALPTDLTGLRTLEQLLIKHNQLGNWPTSLTGLISLKHLDLSHNELAPALSPEVGQLKELKTLCLNGNPGLQQLPIELAELPALEELQVERCPNLKPVPHRRNLKGNELGQYLNKLRRSHGQAVPMQKKPRIPEGQMDMFSGAAAPATGKRPQPVTTPSVNPGRPFNRSNLPKPESGPRAMEDAPTHELLESLLTYFRQGDKNQETAGLQLLRTLDDDDLYRALFDRWNTSLLSDEDHSRWRWAFRHGVTLSKRQVLSLLKDNDNGFLKKTFDLSSVTEISLDAAEAAIPGILKCFPGLQHLDMYLNKTMLPPEVDQLRQLVTVDISGIRQKRPLHWQNLPALRSLRLRNTHVPSLSCLNCPELTSLIYDEGDCKEINLEDCPTLETLKVGKLGLKSLRVMEPAPISTLVLSGAPEINSIVLPPLDGLKTLHLHEHTNDRLLKEALISKALEVLTINNPPTYGIHQRNPRDPIHVPMPASTRLKEVMLKNLGLKEFPLWLLDQPGLIEVSLPMNKISVVPADWRYLDELKKLNISENQITSLPPGIKLPESLESIDLSGNRLRKVPIELAGLPVLKRLALGMQTNHRLADTTLDDIPSEISMKPGLKLDVKLRKQDLRRMRARNAAALMHLGRPWEGELTRDWEKPTD